MKNIFKLINITLFVSLLAIFVPTNSFAQCNVGFKIGENVKEVEKKFGSPVIISEGLSIMEIPVEEVCPRENLGYSVVEYYFLYDELAAYKIVVDNYDDNSESDKLLLYKYVKKNYGDIIDKKEPPKYWRGFKSWDKQNQIIVYSKMDFAGILNEALYISNNKYHEAFTVYESGESEIIE